VRVTKVTVSIVGVVAVVWLMAAGCSRELRRDGGADVATAIERTLGNFEASSETRSLLRQVSDAAWRLDAAALYRALPDGGETARSVRFAAREERGRRFVTHATNADPGSAPQSTNAPGDGVLMLGATPLGNAAGDYRLDIGAALATGSADVSGIWRGLPEELRDLERTAWLASVQREFPRTTELVLRYVTVDGDSRPSSAGVGVDVVLRPKLERLRADYPSLARYATRVGASVRSSGALQNDEGSTLVVWTFREAADALSISFRAADGRLIAADDARPGIDLLEPQRLRLVYSTTLQAYGVTTRIRGIRGAIRTDPRAATVESRISGEPDELSIAGALFGVVPISAVDVFIPGTLAGSVRRVLATPLLGRDGRGIEMSTELDAGAGQEHVIRSTLRSDVPAGRFARLALRLAASLLQVNDREQAEMRALGLDLASRLRADILDRGAASRPRTG
jgi:hypothetical protein